MDCDSKKNTFFWGGAMAQMKMGEGSNFQIAGNIVT